MLGPGATCLKVKHHPHFENGPDICLSIQQVCPGHLFCARHCAGCWVCNKQ